MWPNQGTIRDFPGELGKATETTFMMAKVPAELRIENLPNTSLERYRYENLSVNQVKMWKCDEMENL